MTRRRLMAAVVLAWCVSMLAGCRTVCAAGQVACAGMTATARCADDGAAWALKPCDPGTACRVVADQTSTGLVYVEPRCVP